MTLRSQRERKRINLKEEEKKQFQLFLQCLYFDRRKGNTMTTIAKAKEKSTPKNH